MAMCCGARRFAINVYRTRSVSLSLALYCRCQCHTHTHAHAETHTKMFYKQFSSWLLCVFVHSFNYLAIKYDEPRSLSLSLSLWRGVVAPRSLSPVAVPIPALSALYGHVLLGDRVSLWLLPCARERDYMDYTIWYGIFL